MVVLAVVEQVRVLVQMALVAPTPGTVNTGGGGAGGSAPRSSCANGGSGIVLIRYKFQ